MQKIATKNLTLALTLVLFSLGTPVYPAGAAGGSWIDFDCADHKLHVMVGGDPSLIEVHKSRDGSIRISGSDGDSVIASCDMGCLEVDGTAACSTSGPRPTLSFDVSCSGGETFEITGGTDQSSCAVDLAQDGSVTGGSCSDSNGNSASVDCGANGGEGSCRSSSGSGSCQCVSCRHERP